MIFSNKHNKIYFFLPSFQKGGISKISINLINYFIKKKRKILLFTLDKNMAGPDHSCSCDFTDLKELIYGIREIEKSLGSRIKKPTSTELKNAKGMKRSIVAKVDIKKGEKIKKKHLVFKRPSGGLDINYYDLIIGKKSAKDIKADSLFNFDMIKW